MGVFEMVVAIVLVVTIGKVVASKQRHRAEGSSFGDTAEAQRMREEIRSMRERISVLERVITDNERGLRLDHEIERLRDKDRA